MKLPLQIKVVNPQLILFQNSFSLMVFYRLHLIIYNIKYNSQFTKKIYLYINLGNLNIWKNFINNRAYLIINFLNKYNKNIIIIG